MDIFLLFLCICSGKSAAAFFFIICNKYNSVTGVTPESVENLISFDINVINSPQDNKSFEQSNVFFQAVLIASTLVNTISRTEKKQQN